MPAFSIVIKTDTDLTVNADFTAAASCPRLSVNIKAFRGDRVGPGQDIAYRWQEWDLRCTERALAHSVILAAQISECAEGDAVDLALESVREGIAALLYAKAHGENRLVADELMSCIISSCTVTDPEAIKRRNDAMDRAHRMIAELSDCDPVSGEEYGTGA